MIVKVALKLTERRLAGSLAVNTTKEATVLSLGIPVEWSQW